MSWIIDEVGHPLARVSLLQAARSGGIAMAGFKSGRDLKFIWPLTNLMEPSLNHWMLKSFIVTDVKANLQFPTFR